MKIRIIRLLFFLLILFCISQLEGQENQPSFSFVQLCDPQLGMGGYEHDIMTLGQAVKQINALACDFVVVCGDLVHHAADSSFRDFREIVGGLDMPVYLAAGNHDVGGEPSDSSLRYYRAIFGDDYYCFVHGDYVFVVTNTQLWKRPLDRESGKHHRWFKRTLKRNARKDIPMVVIGHHPLFIADPSEEEVYFNFPPDIREEVLGLMRESGVQAYLSGHAHETLLNEFQGIQFITGESTSKNFDKRPLGFRIWEAGPEGLSHRFIPLADELQGLPEKNN